VHPSGYSRRNHRCRYFRFHLPTTRKRIAPPSTSIREIILRTEVKTDNQMPLVVFPGRYERLDSHTGSIQAKRAIHSHHTDSGPRSLPETYSHDTHYNFLAHFAPRYCLERKSCTERAAEVQETRDRRPIGCLYIDSLCPFSSA
jgi:hypothetical protein